MLFSVAQSDTSEAVALLPARGFIENSGENQMSDSDPVDV